MANSKITSLPATTSVLGAIEVPVNNAGVDEKLTLSQIEVYTSPTSNGASATQTGFASDTYIDGSSVVVAPARLQAKTWYRLTCEVEKTAAGIAIAQIVVRMGTLGAIGDAAIQTLAFASAGTAAVDKGQITVLVNFNSVGSGTSAVIRSSLILLKQNSNTGFVSAGSVFMGPTTANSSGFASNAVTRIGLSLNAGTSAAWTLANVQTELQNLAP